MDRLRQLEECGQAVWVDYIQRDFIVNGELGRLMREDGVTGVTSNPTIFEKAINESPHYDDGFRKLLEADPHMDAVTVYDKLSVEDIRMAADVLRPAYDRTQGSDGFVSIEVSPYLSGDTEGSIAEARRLWREVSRPNLMVKIPATREGIPAIEACLSEGININITLMFSLAHYKAVAEAFLRAVTRCPHPETLSSVASVFISRIDTMIDPLLQAIGTPEALALQGKIAIANAKVIYQEFRNIFHGERFSNLRNRGAHVQRVLWGSTGTKNPAYSDVLYVEELIGPETINTMPLKTLSAFRDHGQVRGATIQDGLEAARMDLAKLKDLGIDLGAITEKLQQEGLAAFTQSFDKLLAGVEKKCHAAYA
ncbi:MAG TPA: transaldolase [Bryobacteraceae bacterium]